MKVDASNLPAEQLTARQLGGEYAEGHRDGFIECLDELERPQLGGGYKGPLPTELKRWIKNARRRGELTDGVPKSGPR